MRLIHLTKGTPMSIRAIVISPTTVPVIMTEYDVAVTAPIDSPQSYYFVVDDAPGVLPVYMAANEFFGTYETLDWRYETRFVTVTKL